MVLTSPLDGIFLNICATTLDELWSRCRVVVLYSCALISHFNATIVRPTPLESPGDDDDDDEDDDVIDDDDDDDDDDDSFE